MIIFTNDKSAKFCLITLCVKRFIHKRKVVPFLFSAPWWQKKRNQFSFVCIIFNTSQKLVNFFTYIKNV